MSEKFQWYKKDETVVHNVRRYGSWFTNALLGLGAVLTATPAAPVGVAILGPTLVDKSMDLTAGKEIEQGYNNMKKSGRLYLFGQSSKQSLKATG